jgi:hypothetical protein
MLKMEVWVMRSYAQLFLLSAVLPLALPVACAPQPPEVRASVTYSYDRPRGLADQPKAAALAIPAVAGEDARSAAEKKAFSLAAAIEIPLARDEAEQTIDEVGEIFRVKDDRYRFKVYVSSGMVKFRDTELYNQTPKEEQDLSPLTGETAIARAEEVLERLATAGLVELDELLLPAARIYFRKEQSYRGAELGESGRPRPGPAEVADIRVFVPRAINGVGVSGHGVRMVFTKRKALAGLDLLWRDVRLDNTERPVDLTMAQAKERFEKSLDLPENARVEVTVNELVYFDPSMRDPVAFLEPVYLFVYQTRVPTREGSEFRVSKMLHHVIPATDHGDVQLPSRRAARLAELQRTLDTKRPEKIAPSTLTMEGEED